MSEPITQKLFFDALNDLRNDLREDLDARHSRLRGDMTEGFRELGHKFDRRDRDLTAIDKRVVEIEAARKVEEKQQVQRGAWAGLLASAGLNAVLVVIKDFWSR